MHFKHRNKFRLTRFIIFQISLILRFLSKFRKPAKRILIVKIDAIGDYVLFRNYLEVVYKSDKFKGYEIELLGNYKWKDLAIEYDGQYVSKFWFIDEESFYEAPKKLFKLALKLFSRRFDIVLQSTYSRTLMGNAFSILATGREAIAYNSDNEQHPKYKRRTDKFYTTLLDLPPAFNHEFARNHYFFKSVTDNPTLKLPELKLIPNRHTRSGILLFPGSSYYKRNWEKEKFSELIRRLLKETNEIITIAGGPADKSIACSLLGQVPPTSRIVDKTGYTTLPDFVELVAASTLVISNDTSTVHIAVACKTPVICIQGGGHFNRFTPYPDEMPFKPICVYEKMPCFNCNWICKFPTLEYDPFPCISRVNIESVWEKVQKTLNEVTATDVQFDIKKEDTSQSNLPIYDKKKAPLISIITVTLNAAKYLEDCITSVINQSSLNIEHLIFDGGSTDGTLEIINKYERHITYWQSEKDKGIYDAMNKAVKKAKGEWVYFLGADDTLLKGFSFIASRLKDNYTIYYGDLSYNGISTPRSEYSTLQLTKENICHQAILYPRAVFDFYKYDLSYSIAADWLLNIRLWTDKRFKFKYYPYIIANFSSVGISSLQTDDKFLKDKPRIIKEAFGPFIYYQTLYMELKKKKKKKHDL
ncbi:glycosyltransferase [Arcticibacter tournemirensis]|uniref:Glycosyltransferase n=1 Tax=Arcticibacter tournemirensis TaxID=699437 RepID=A0A4Q0M8P9_9SPHI|nr:glycosyltransferase [Arcticibacter tournemirensis]RXF69096.1 glycosyltransferase [Arcticibacter tournemirensis]